MDTEVNFYYIEMYTQLKAVFFKDLTAGSNIEYVYSRKRRLANSHSFIKPIDASSFTIGWF